MNEALRKHYAKTLAHHGILGQKWGKRMGPPYPLDASNHSSSEKKAGWKKSLDKSDDSEHTKSADSENQNAVSKKSLTDKQKKYIKVGVGVAATALVLYGGYKLNKSGKLDGLKDEIFRGKNKTEELLKDAKFGELKAESFTGETKTSGGFKKTAHKESLTEIIRNVNPNRGNPEYDNNCTYCGVTTFLRSVGLDVTAKDTGGKPQNLGGVIESCFKNARIIDGSAATFGKSRQDAAAMLKRKFGDNAAGVVGVTRVNGAGHTFNWFIKDGVVSFIDGQNVESPINNPKSVDAFWQSIDKSGLMTLARLDNAEIIEEAIKKIVN